MKTLFENSGLCLSDEELGRYPFAKGADRDRMDRHLAGCADCLELIAVVPSKESVSPPESLVRRIQSLPSRTSYRRNRRAPAPGKPLLRLAVAAGLLLAVGTILWFAPRPAAEKPPVQAKTPPVVPGKKPTPPLPEELFVPLPEPKEEKIVRETPVEKTPVPRPEKSPETKPEPEKKSEPAPPRETRVAKILSLEVSGTLIRENGPDPVKPGDLLRTPFGGEARIRFQGIVLWMDHRTHIRLEEGPRVVLERGKICIRSAPGLEVRSPAGTIRPLGTEFLVEADEKGTTSVVVRAGSVLFENEKGGRNVPAGCRSTGKGGRKPGPAVRLRNLSPLFSWVEKVDLAVGTEQAPFVRLYSTGKRSPLVITAPHVPVETRSKEIASFVAEKLDVPLVVGHGYKGARRIVLNEPGDDEAGRHAYQEYVTVIRDAAHRLPLPFLVEIHAYGVKNDETPVIEISTSGFRKAELERLKRLYEKLLEKYRPEIRALLVFDLTDPAYEVDGRKRNFKYGSDILRKSGVFQKKFAARGWKVELPWAVRYPGLERYRTILADLVRAARRG